MASVGRLHIRRRGRAGHGDGYASPDIYLSCQQYRLLGGTIPRCLLPQCLDPAGRASGHPTRRARTWSGARDPRSVPAGGLHHSLRLHRATECLRHDSHPVLVRGAQPSRHCELHRRHSPPRHRLRRSGRGGAFPGLGRRANAGSDRRHRHRCRRREEPMDTDRVEYSPDRAGGLVAREPPLVARYRSGHARFYPLPVSIPPPYGQHLVESHQAAPRCPPFAGLSRASTRPGDRGHRDREEHSDLRPAGPANVRLRDPCAANARHRLAVIPDDREEPEWAHFWRGRRADGICHTARRLHARSAALQIRACPGRPDHAPARAPPLAPDAIAHRLLGR